MALAVVSFPLPCNLPLVSPKGSLSSWTQYYNQYYIILYARIYNLTALYVIAQAVDCLLRDSRTETHAWFTVLQPFKSFLSVQSMYCLCFNQVFLCFNKSAPKVFPFCDSSITVGLQNFSNFSPGFHWLFVVSDGSERCWCLQAWSPQSSLFWMGYVALNLASSMLCGEKAASPLCDHHQGSSKNEPSISFLRTIFWAEFLFETVGPQRLFL